MSSSSPPDSAGPKVVGTEPDTSARARQTEALTAMIPTPGGADVIFGDRLPLAERFVAMLGDTGASQGLIGPRESPRLWARHVLNCAVVSDVFSGHGSRVIDVGSGGGLPGIALAIRRADLDVHLIEPMLRRTTWLGEALKELGLDNVTVHRARAEEMHGALTAPYVTARAVARLDRLIPWCAPLLDLGGTLVAMKGASARDELAESLRLGIPTMWGLSEPQITELGGDVLADPTLVITLTRTGSRRSPGPRKSARR